ncbi:FecR family protein [Parabacteroides pacaensis]|uniref:FecR family protein n=1 Tax=Parabacteroides pacaensis TaxID=2086575 RepID=UPI000D0F2573|nr:FecR domain-containing protein [Parabacteroides pacaensis]
MDDFLILKFIEKQCSAEDARKVLQWIEADEENKKHFTRLQAIWTAIEMEHMAPWDKVDPAEVQYIMEKIGKKHYRRIISLSLAGCVAVAAAILFCVFFLRQPKNVYDYEKALAEVSNQKEITLSIHNEKKIELPDSSVVVTYNKKGQILINDTITVDEPSKKEEQSLNVIYVPYGKRSVIILEDGTKVHLNSGSSLAYPANFTSDKREVYLEGEAYFEVAKESARKFIVLTAYKSVEVLGTQFNVCIDKSFDKFETVLVTGKIGLESKTGKIELSPNQYYGLSYTSGEEELKTVDVEEYISWVDGKLKFQKEPLARVLNKLEKSYNIRILLTQSKYLGYTITGSLNLKDTPEETLNVLMKILIPNYKSQKQTLYQIKSK